VPPGGCPLCIPQLLLDLATVGNVSMWARYRHDLTGVSLTDEAYVVVVAATEAVAIGTTGKQTWYSMHRVLLRRRAAYTQESGGTIALEWGWESPPGDLTHPQDATPTRSPDT